MGICHLISKRYDTRDVVFSGSSGGSWSALLFAANIDFLYALELMCSLGPLDFGPDPGFLSAYGRYDKSVQRVFNTIFSSIDLAQRVKNRLQIALSVITWGKVESKMIDDFVSNQDVLDCIIASSLIPFAVNGKPWVRYRGFICLDAALTNVKGVVLDGNGNAPQQQPPPPSSHRNEEEKAEEEDDDALTQSGGVSTSGGGCRRLVNEWLETMGKFLSPAKPSTPSSLPVDKEVVYGLGTLARKSTASISCHIAASTTEKLSGIWSVFSLFQTTKAQQDPPTPCTSSSASSSSSRNSRVTAAFSEDTEAQDVHTLTLPSSSSSSSGVEWHESIKGKPFTCHEEELVLEISPWMWRIQAPINYHLTSDPCKIKELFQLGFEDAKAHQVHLDAFFH